MNLLSEKSYLLLPPVSSPSPKSKLERQSTGCSKTTDGSPQSRLRVLPFSSFSPKAQKTNKELSKNPFMRTTNRSLSKTVKPINLKGENMALNLKNAY